MKYSKKIVLKNNKECLLRNAVASDAQQVYDIFNLTHSQTDFLLSEIIETKKLSHNILVY